MNKIVLIILRRPYDPVGMSLLIVLFGGLTIPHMPTDVIPHITIPVTSIVGVEE
jgi:multidrug efflux pump subunit AcrB